MELESPECSDKDTFTPVALSPRVRRNRTEAIVELQSEPISAVMNKKSAKLKIKHTSRA